MGDIMGGDGFSEEYLRGVEDGVELLLAELDRQGLLTGEVKKVGMEVITAVKDRKLYMLRSILGMC